MKRLTDTAGAHLASMCRRSVVARLRRYSMTVQTADLDDMSSEATLLALRALQAGSGWEAKGIRSIVWQCARSAVVDWIDQRSTRPVAEPELIESLQAHDERPIEDLPGYVAQLAPGLLREAFALSRAADDATACDMLSSCGRSISPRTLRRRKQALREALAIMAPV